jgi:catechol 2,3-dioxygenase-like lactoylglutathione lyase family enzyme
MAELLSTATPEVHFRPEVDVEINGMAHVILTVRDFAGARKFYGELLPFLGLTPVIDSPEYYYCVGGRTALGLRPADPAHADERYAQGRSGLHHLCFRARSREDVDELHRFLVARGARIVHPPEEAGFAPGYYSVLFEDPDGIRLEANFVPGRGLLEPGVRRGS